MTSDEDPAAFANIPDAPMSLDLALLDALSADLDALCYTVDGVFQLLGPQANDALSRDQVVPALLVTADVGADHPDHALATVIRLWLLGEMVPEAGLAAALPTLGLDGLRRLGLAAPVTAGTDDASSWEALVDFRPYGWGPGQDGTGGAELRVASDLAASQRPGVLRRDHVLGIGQASLTLAQCTIRRKVDRALDLGTGCGIQTFHLLQHALHVTATDISARALAFTRFNILLNAGMLGVKPERPAERVSLRLGSMLQPVAGESFDLVVSNPPFVITPRHAGETEAEQFTYRDGGLPGDDIIAQLVRDLPSVLGPGGTAQLLGNWEIPGDEPWDARPRGWIVDTADAWFIQRDVATPAQYAETWLQDASQARDRDLYLADYAAYLSDFASRSVKGVGFGYVWLRNPLHPHADRLRRFEEITYPIENPAAEALAAAVERFDWLQSADLDRAHLVVADDVTEERHAKPGAEHPGVILLRQGAGLRRTTLLSTELAGFVSACDGDLAVGQIIPALAALLDRSDADFASSLLGAVRNLVLEGFLLPG